jgi:CubicO group peptidase (beta-lactamase class C family)
VNDPRFGAVVEAFHANFSDDDELGASCCVIVEGRVVVDVWGGWADVERTRPWQRDTLCNSYSVGKPIVALSVLQLVADGRVHLDEPAQRWWPELTTTATVREALSHRAGVPAVREPLSNEDLWSWERMCAALARTEPWWTPGERHAYHTNTYGHLVGEIARRVTGELPGTWLRRLGLDLHWGVDEADLGRCADVSWDGAVRIATHEELAQLPEEPRMVFTGYFNPPGFSSQGVVNTTEWRRCQVPSTNLHATGRAIAELYAGLLDGAVLEPSVLAEATSTQSEGWCPVLERDVRFGLGFQPTRPDRPFGPNPGSYGHFGTGGALGFADPAAGVAFGYTMNAVRPRWQSSRNRRLVDAVYESLA